MAILRKREMKELSADNIQKRLAELKLELAKDRAQSAVGGSPPSPGLVRERRRTIAKLLTEIRKRRAEAQTPIKKAKEEEKAGSM